MVPDAPFNVALLDVDKFVRERRIQPVTSLSISEPSSSEYARQGLFSEEVFGPLGSTERMTTFGQIDLHTHLMQPLIYKNVLKLGSIYEEIITGASHALWDDEKKDFTRCPDPQHHPEAGTGFTFFLNHLHEIKFTRNNSRIRSDRIDIIEKYKDRLLCDKLIVLPAGLRDLEEEQGTLTTDDINKLYLTLMSYALALPIGAQSTIFDGVRSNLQRKAVEIYNYIENILTGKRGFIQGTWGHRQIALGTRNVITAATYATMTPNDPQTIQPDETKSGLFQTMKSLQPIVVHHVRSVFFDTIFGSNTNMVPLIDPKTMELAYREIPNSELARFDSSEAIEGWISRFRNIDIRFNPVQVKAVDGKFYYLLMVYDAGDEIYLFRGLSDFKTVSGKQVDLKKVRPLTWAELFYMATVNAADNKHAFITRYPVIQDESCYPSKIHLMTTVPSRVVKLTDAINGGTILTYPEYPILKKPFLDSVQVATSRLGGLGGDYDGDTISFNALLSEDANAEVAQFMTTKQSIMNAQRQLHIAANDDLIRYTIASLSSA